MITPSTSQLPGADRGHCLAFRYALPSGANPIVVPGAHVGPGAVLAEAPPSPILIALPASLGVTRSDEIVLSKPVGTIAQAGERIASARQGVRARHVTAPVMGRVAAPHPLGTIAITPETGALQVRARFGGEVIASEESHIVIATAAERIPFAYSVNIGARPASLAVDAALLQQTLTTRTRIPPLSSDAALVVTHIEDMQTLAHVRRHVGALLIIGSVTETVAWEMCTSANGNVTPSGDPAVLVLSGLGNADSGARAIAPLRGWHGATVLIDAETRHLILVNEGGTVRKPADTDDLERSVFFREPAYWGESGMTRGDAHNHALESGLRVIAVETQSAQHGTALTPVENFGKSA